jgi:Cid1 family poly A polymerase
MEKVGLQRDPRHYWHNVNDLDTVFLTCEQAKQVWKRPEHFDSHPISNVALLYGFFNFYVSIFKRQSCMVSIKRGKETVYPKTCFPKCNPFFTIEDPFETFDSHCPHDLGVPVQETQCHNILACLEEAEKHMRELLLRHDDLNDDTLETLWPTAATRRPENQENQGGKTRKKGDNGAGARGGNRINTKGRKGKQIQVHPRPAANATEKTGVHRKPGRAANGKGTEQSLRDDKHNDQGANQDKVVDSHLTQEPGQNPSERKQDGTQKLGKKKPRKPRNKQNKGGTAGGTPKTNDVTSTGKPNEGSGRGPKGRQPGGHQNSNAQKSHAET